MAEVVRSKKLDQMSKDYMNGVVPTKEVLKEVHEELMILHKAGTLDADGRMFLRILGETEEKFKEKLEDPTLVGGVCSVLNIF